MDILIIVILVIVILVCLGSLFYFLTYNKYQDYIIRINEVESIIDNNLRNKYDLINRSISLIKDRKLNEAYNEFIGLKEKHKKLNDSEELNKIDTQIKEINETLTTSINYYNKNISSYNKLLKSFPSNIIALLCKYKEKLFFDRKDMSDEDYEDFKL